jgi:hypothetical protein
MSDAMRALLELPTEAAGWRIIVAVTGPVKLT